MIDPSRREEARLTDGLRPCADCGQMVDPRAAECPICGRQRVVQGSGPGLWVFLAVLAVILGGFVWSAVREQPQAAPASFACLPAPMEFEDLIEIAVEQVFVGVRLGKARAVHAPEPGDPGVHYVAIKVHRSEGERRRHGVWKVTSDGTVFSANDVAFEISGLKRADSSTAGGAAAALKCLRRRRPPAE